MFNNVYANTTVLVTGHTGFKGAWLTTWLLELGATVVGFSLPTLPTDPSLYNLAGLNDKVIDVRGDIRNLQAVEAVIATHQPSIVFHLAAQPIVHLGYKEPEMTFAANAGGTVNVLEAIRNSDCVKALVSITTDKVYADQDWVFGYRENDRLGGHDPYSASKAMAELAIESYRATYFAPERFAEHGVGIASARAGNVIGGGDLAAYRLVPDCMKALMDNAVIGIRTPHTIRPWQHVLVPLSGYLWLGVKLLEDGGRFSEAWNFGPVEQKGVTTGQIVDKLVADWGGGRWEEIDLGLPKIETGQLRLSWDKSAEKLAWQPVYDWEDAIAEIVAFFKAYQRGDDIHQTVIKHIGDYCAKATSQNLPWTVA